MNSLINVMNNNQYFKLSAESLLQNLELEEKLAKDLIKMYDLKGIYAIKMENIQEGGKLGTITLKLNNMNFYIFTRHETVIENLRHKERLVNFIDFLCNGLDNEEKEEVNSYIQDNYDLKCRLATSKKILEIPVLVNRELYLTTTFELLSKSAIARLNTSLNFDFKYSSENNSTFTVLNGLHLPNQYPSGKLCLGQNKKYPDDLNEIDTFEEFNVFKEGSFNRDIDEVSEYNESLFEYILDTIKDFAIKNQFSSDSEKKKVANLLIKQFKYRKEEIKSDLDNFLKVGNYYDVTYGDFFRHNYSLYLLLSLFH